MFLILYKNGGLGQSIAYFHQTIKNPEGCDLQGFEPQGLVLLMTEIHKPTIPHDDSNANTFDGGFVKLHRSILEKTIWKRPNLFRLFSFILMSVKWTKDTYSDGRIRIELLPGQMVGSHDYLAKQTGLTRNQIKTHLGFLQKQRTIDAKVTQGLTVITLLNFEAYHARKSNSDAELTQGWRRVDAELTLSKELKKKRNKELKGGERAPLNFPPHLKEIWTSYAQSHERSYGVPTLPPHKSQIRDLEALHEILGEHAPGVVSYYCGLNVAFYGKKKHALRYCVEDAHKLYTDYMQRRTNG